MTRKILQILLTTAIVGILIFIGVTVYQIRHQSTQNITGGSSDFPALNLLSEEIDNNSKSLIKANLQIYTDGKFNPQTAYILADNYTKTPQPDGTTSFQFYMTIPEAKSTYQISFTTSFLDDPTIDVVCAPASLQPDGAKCYQPATEEAYITQGVVYA